MARTPLNDLVVQRLPIPDTGQVTHWDTNPRGFGLRLSQGGSRTFVVKVDGRMLTIGRYPDMSLKTARSEAKKLQTAVPSSLTPTTFLEAKMAFLERAERRVKIDTYKQYVYHLGKCTFTKNIADITKRDILAALKVFDDKPTSQNLMLSTLRNFFNWCVEAELIDTYPLLRVSSPNRLKSRDRVLSDDELVRIWNAADYKPYGNLLRLLILTAGRKMEVRTLIHDDQYITFKDTKNKTDHTLPITPLIRAHLIPQPYKFDNWEREKKRFDIKCGVTGWRVHDLRRTWATIAAKLGIRSEVIERVLNHKRSGIVQVYQRYEYASEMKNALLTVEAHLQTLLKPRASTPEPSTAPLGVGDENTEQARA